MREKIDAAFAVDVNCQAASSVDFLTFSESKLQVGLSPYRLLGLWARATQGMPTVYIYIYIYIKENNYKECIMEIIKNSDLVSKIIKNQCIIGDNLKKYLICCKPLKSN